MPIEIRELIIRAIVDENTNEMENRLSPQNTSSDHTNTGMMERLEELKKMMKDKNER